MEIAKMLTISTAHISLGTARMLNDESSDLFAEISAYDKGGYGWWIYCSPFAEPDYDCSVIPVDLWDCMMLARKNDCEWLCLDGDGEIVDGLSTHRWYK